MSPLEAGPSLQSPQALSRLQSRWWGQDHTATHPGWSPADARPGFLPVSHGGRGCWRHYQPSAPPPTPPSPGRNPGKCKEAGDPASHPARGPSWCMGQEEGPSLLDTPSHGSAAIKEPPVSGSRKVPLEPDSPLGESGGAHLTITCSAVLAPAEKWSSVQHARSRVTWEGAKASSTPTFLSAASLKLSQTRILESP